jgi:hypothetical protein
LATEKTKPQTLWQLQPKELQGDLAAKTWFLNLTLKHTLIKLVGTQKVVA